MQALSQRYRKVIEKGSIVKKWIENEKQNLERSLVNTHATEVWGIGAGMFGVSVVASLITLFVTFGGSNPSREWPMIGWIFVALGVGGVAIWTTLGIPAHRETEALCRAKREERTQDPLWQRAELILRAVEEYKLHCNRYEAWYGAVDEEIQDEDKVLEERYHGFLVRAYLVIDTAINNFTRAAELMERQAKHLSAHPELARSAESTHLMDLMAKLNQPVEVPAAISLMDARRALEHEEALAEVVRNFDEGELTRQIEALPTSALPQRINSDESQ